MSAKYQTMRLIVPFHSDFSPSGDLPEQLKLGKFDWEGGGGGMLVRIYFLWVQFWIRLAAVS